MNDINIIIRVLPSGDELELELPLHTTVKEIIDELVSSGYVPGSDPQGNPYSYDISVKGDTNKQIMPEKTLYDIGIKNESTLLLMPRLVAGNW